MKKWILLFVFILACPVWAGDFRDATWGMTREEVKAVEKSEIIEERKYELQKVGDALVYREYPGKDSSLVFYYFNRGKLYKGEYWRRYGGKRTSRKDYSKAKKLLSNKFGEPKKDGTTWENGRLAYCAEWEAGNTNIELIVYGESSVVNHTIIYRERHK